MFKKPEPLEAQLDTSAVSERCLKFWDEHSIYTFNPSSNKQRFSVDTPPPYVSASHLHVGHALSYTQAEIIVRYQRMRGKEIFYPMGFDDNGLPTERHVEKLHNIKSKDEISRSDFRALCHEETSKGAKSYEDLWRSLAISVDWSLKYSTIDSRSQRVAQLSFIDLFKKGLIYRAEEPVLWDTALQSALAQADLETIERKGKLHDIAFLSAAGIPLVISTSRPELIPACVALFANPEDNRYKSLLGSNATVPLFNYTVPVLSSDQVDPNFGTGLMMVCTFGDGEDVVKWKDHKLDTRICVSPSGKMTELAGPYSGLPTEEARARILEDLHKDGSLKYSKSIKQFVTVGERSGQPIEFHMAPQWFIRVLENKERFLRRAEELDWTPEYMKLRLINWIDNLKYDWNISRQRYYGVPFPVWYVMDKFNNLVEIVVANEEDLPVDPTEDLPPKWAREKYADMTFVPETDVMDTWMTSSVSPMINADWRSLDTDLRRSGIYPMDLRVQAHEIIRTWLFYSIIKADYHSDSLPWKAAMISGWGLNEQGKKISKRSLDSETDASGFNRYNPEHLIEKYGADAVRYWAAGASLGQDLRFSEKEIKRGRAAATKLWNAARLAFMYNQEFDYEIGYVAVEQRPVEDQWILSELDKTVARATSLLDVLDYAGARNEIDRMFFHNYCDHFIEFTKLRFQSQDDWSETEIAATKCTLYEATRAFIGLYAPFMPFVTEEIYQKGGRFGEAHLSVHVTSWPVSIGVIFERGEDMDIILSAVNQSRKKRSQDSIGANTLIENVTIYICDDIALSLATNLKRELGAAIKAKNVHLIRSEHSSIEFC